MAPSGSSAVSTRATTVASKDPAINAMKIELAQRPRRFDGATFDEEGERCPNFSTEAEALRQSADY